MNHTKRMSKAAKYDALAKRLRREEQSFWREVSDRREEVIQYLGCSIGVEGTESPILEEPTIYAQSHIHSGLSIGETAGEEVNVNEGIITERSS